ncbi:MAG: uncharacterized protein K0S45_571 [Nitrospira sp.]|jgi:hypothetical protein|nr:uncharacterized protein [Nitrospira sp.]
MNSRPDEQPDPLASAVKRLLDQSAQALDPKTALLVQRARLHALSRTSRGPRWFAWAGGAALASIVTLWSTLWISQPVGTNHSHLPLLEDLELMQSPENIELSEDFEFFDWLDRTGTEG